MNTYHQQRLQLLEVVLIRPKDHGDRDKVK
jgi:hypothetical protein